MHRIAYTQEIWIRCINLQEDSALKWLKKSIPQLTKNPNQHSSVDLNHTVNPAHTPNIYYPGEQKIYQEKEESSKFQSPMDNDHIQNYEDLGSNTNVRNLFMKNLESFSPLKMGKLGRNLLQNSQNLNWDLSGNNEKNGDIPKLREVRIKEAFEDHERGAKEQNRYFSRLERSNRKQKAVFVEHFKYILSQTI